MDFPIRKTDLVVEWLGDEALIFTPENAQAHCLNPLISRIFRLCDGLHSQQELADSLAVYTPCPEERQSAVEASLAILHEHGILQSGSHLRRREFLAAASALMPLVLTVAAPSPAAASSTTCITNAQCGSGAFGCNPCSPSTGACPPNNYCMRTYSVKKAANGRDAAPGTTCLDDTLALGFVPNCEQENAGGIWDRNCATARAAVIAAQLPGQSVSNYKCCFC